MKEFLKKVTRIFVCHTNVKSKSASDIFWSTHCEGSSYLHLQSRTHICIEYSSHAHEIVNLNHTSSILCAWSFHTHAHESFTRTLLYKTVASKEYVNTIWKYIFKYICQSRESCILGLKKCLMKNFIKNINSKEIIREGFDKKKH